ncbi:hypothetical protein [Thermoflavifilum sp.]|uniref:hypothetical protein n=1 Tax=Thermoflavifilum sp. TaxID=1968839 RepID=UPI0025ED7216|nr:hypothetical protein [Thermoflavifilum sp.]
MERDEVAQDVPMHREQEARAARFEPLEKVRAAKADQATAGAVEVVEDALFIAFRTAIGISDKVLRHPITWQLKLLDHLHDIFAKQARVLVGGVVLGDRKGKPLRHTQRKVCGLVSQQDVVALLLFVEMGIVADDELARAPHEEQPHQVAPILRGGALLEGTQRARRGLKLRDKVHLVFSELCPRLEEAFGAHVQILVFVEEQAQLVAEVAEVLVVRRGGEQ